METNNLTVTKTTVECYKIRHPQFWADINIDSLGNQGRIQIASAYGSWQFFWGACGKPFKKFLQGVDKYYVAGKFGSSKWFDAIKTVAEFKQVIEANINDGYLNTSDGADALEELDQLNDLSEREEFCRCLSDCDQIMRIYDHCPALIFGIDPQFEHFWTTVWPILLNEFKKEETINELVS
jgi:hypothetical protein